MRLSPQISRLLAFLIPIGLVWLGAANVVAPVMRQLDDDLDSIAHSSGMLARFDRLAMAEPQLRRQLESLKARASAHPDFLQGGGALVAADFQQNVQQWVASAGASFRASRALSKHTEDAFERVGVTVELVASPEQLENLLYTIETAQPGAFIDHLSINVPEDDRAAGGANGTLELSVHFDVYSYIKAGPHDTKS